MLELYDIFSEVKILPPITCGMWNISKMLDLNFLWPSILIFQAQVVWTDGLQLGLQRLID